MGGHRPFIVPCPFRVTLEEATMTMYRFISWFVLGLPFAFNASGQPAQRQSLEVFAQLGLTPQQLAAIDEGRPVAKVLSWGGPSEVYVFGAVHVNGSPTTYLRASRDITRLAGTPGYFGIGELPRTARIADLNALALDADDVKALKSCREDACDVQLPTASIQAFHDAVNWSQPDAADQVNTLARGMVLDLIREYRRGGNAALGTYRDKPNPARISDQFETMVGRTTALPDVMPELRRYVLQYPSAELPGADSVIYWEKVNFGMKPTIRINHAVIYSARASDRALSTVAIKQLYASHYFHTALDVTVCVADAARSASRGFYLLTLKGSEQEGLTGAKGSMLRKIIVDKTRSSLERALASIKHTVEQSAPTSERCPPTTCQRATRRWPVGSDIDRPQPDFQRLARTIDVMVRGTCRALRRVGSGDSTEGNDTMERMLVVVFDSAEKAFEASHALHRLDEDGMIAVYADVVVVKDADGATIVTTSKGAIPQATIGATVVGGLIGLLGGPVSLAVGAAGGLALGALTDFAKARVSGDFVGEVEKALGPGKVAVVAEIEEDFTGPVDAAMKRWVDSCSAARSPTWPTTNTTRRSPRSRQTSRRRKPNTPRVTPTAGAACRPGSVRSTGSCIRCSTAPKPGARSFSIKRPRKWRT